MQTNKPKKCKNCGNRFTPLKPLQVVCGITCTIEWAMKLKEKKERKQARQEATATRQAILKLKPLSYYAKIAQTAFNAFIRARDGKVCISCGTRKPDIQYCAGHFRTVKAASQHRFNEDNVNTQCNKHCNMMLSGNIQNYRPALIEKIGQERYEKLMNDNRTVRYTVEDLKEITKKYRKLLKEMKI